MRKTLVLDLDDTLGPLSPSIYDAMNKTFGENINYHTTNTFNVSELYGVSVKQFHDVIIDNNLLENMVPFPETKALLTDAKEAGYYIKVITARSYHPNGRRITMDWFNKYELPWDTIVVTAHGEDKSDYISVKENVVLSLDDNLSNCTNFKASGKSALTYLYTRPWNRDSDFPRIDNLNEVRQLIDMRGEILVSS